MADTLEIDWKPLGKTFQPSEIVPVLASIVILRSVGEASHLDARFGRAPGTFQLLGALTMVSNIGVHGEYQCSRDGVSVIPAET
jgi:hypothetical protein